MHNAKLGGKFNFSTFIIVVMRKPLNCKRRIFAHDHDKICTRHRSTRQIIAAA